MMTLQKVQAYILHKKLINKDNRILLAISGGKDSVCLAHMLTNLGYNIALAHCNFQLRGEQSDADQAFVVQLADELKLKVFIKNFDTKKESKGGESIQMTARRLRYAWFQETAQKNDFQLIATAHSANDNAETIIYNLTKGSGIKGLRGIKPRSQKVIRPLMCLTTAEILTYLKANDLSWREDESNTLDKYARNKIRHHVVPLLSELNPGVINTLLEQNERLGTLEIFLQNQLAQLKLTFWKQKNETIKIAVSELQKVPGYEYLLYEWLREFGFNGAQIQDGLGANTSGKKIHSESHILYIDRTSWLLTGRDEVAQFKEQIETSSGLLNLPMAELRWEVVHLPPNKVDLTNTDFAFLDLDKIDFPLVIRNWHLGDRFVPYGMTGSQKLSDFLINQKANQLEKQDLLVLEINHKIAWIVGKRVSNEFSINQETNSILKFQLRKKA